MKEIWILGATGRCGRAAAAKLAAAGFPLALVGRDLGRLRALATTIGDELRIVVATSTSAMAEQIAQACPGVVINTIGPFGETAMPLARACPPGTHYVDLSNELTSIIDLLALHDQAASSGRTIVTGAGFGLLATESVVLKLCEGMPPAARVKVAAVPSFASEAGLIGSALAASIIDGLAAGGYRYEDGRLVRTRLFGEFEILAFPDGTKVRTAAAPTGDMEAARRASGAPSAVSASALVPTGMLARMVLPTAVTPLRIKGLRDIAKRRVAKIAMKTRPRSREFSWTFARVTWESGETRQGWLRLGDAMDFTISALVEVASRLAREDINAGSYTPGALFGPELATCAGGEFIFSDGRPS